MEREIILQLAHLGGTMFGRAFSGGGEPDMSKLDLNGDGILTRDEIDAADLGLINRPKGSRIERAEMGEHVPNTRYP